MILTEDGEIDLAIPRRAGSLEPQLVPKGQTRFDGFDDNIHFDVRARHDRLAVLPRHEGERIAD